MATVRICPKCGNKSLDYDPIYKVWKCVWLTCSYQEEDNSIERYEHHGKMVSVDSRLKGKHRDHCLCFKCNLLNIEDRMKNCPIANILFQLCVAFHLVIPVYECPNFKKKEEKNV